MSLSEDGLTVAIVSPGIDAVRVYFYNYVHSKWIQIGQDIDGKRGISVSLSKDGRTVAIA